MTEIETSGLRSLYDELDPILTLYSFSFLSPSDLCQVALTSWAGRELAHDESLWRAHTLRKYPFLGEKHKPTQSCWRLECLVQKRADAFKRAYAQGRVGRISSDLPVMHPVSIFSTACGDPSKSLLHRIRPMPANAAGASPKAGSDLSSGSHFDSVTRRVARQGSCAWSILGPNYKGAEPHAPDSDPLAQAQSAFSAMGISGDEGQLQAGGGIPEKSELASGIASA